MNPFLDCYVFSSGEDLVDGEEILTSNPFVLSLNHVAAWEENDDEHFPTEVYTTSGQFSINTDYEFFDLTMRAFLTKK